MRLAPTPHTIERPDERNVLPPNKALEPPTGSARGGSVRALGRSHQAASCLLDPLALAQEDPSSEGESR